MERKELERSFNHREIPSFLPTNSNMIYSCHDKLGIGGRGLSGGKYRRKPNLYIGVTAHMIGFA
jgi:hypothetical protein